MDKDVARVGDVTGEIGRGMVGQPFAGSRLSYMAEKLRYLKLELGAGRTAIMVAVAFAIVTAEVLVSASVMMGSVTVVPVFRSFVSRVSDPCISRVDAASMAPLPRLDGELVA